MHTWKSPFRFTNRSDDRYLNTITLFYIDEYLTYLATKTKPFLRPCIHTHTLQVAKWVGDLFNEGIYDHHIELKGTPLLGWESPRRMDRLSAEDVMNSSRLYYLFPITRVRSIERILRTTAHSGFLVVSHAKVAGATQLNSPTQPKHRPQLYTRPSVLGDYDTTEVEDSDLGTYSKLQHYPLSCLYNYTL